MSASRRRMRLHVGRPAKKGARARRARPPSSMGRDGTTGSETAQFSFLALPTCRPLGLEKALMPEDMPRSTRARHVRSPSPPREMAAPLGVYRFGHRIPALIRRILWTRTARSATLNVTAVTRTSQELGARQVDADTLYVNFTPRMAQAGGDPCRRPEFPSHCVPRSSFLPSSCRRGRAHSAIAMKTFVLH